MSVPGAWLGGVCAHTARQLGWNTTGVRVAAVVLLLIWPIITGVTYLLVAWWLAREPATPQRPVNPEMDDWDRRLAEVDRHLGR